MRNIHLEMVRVTEAGAIAASKYVGSGNKVAVDWAATEAMRNRLNNIYFTGKIIIGEGKKDKSVGLYEGELVGALRTKLKSAGSVAEVIQEEKRIENIPSYEIAIDPVEGTTPTAKGGYEAISVLALAHEGCFLPTDNFYMKKLAVGPEVANKVKLNITDPLHQTIKLVKSATGKNRISVCVLDRPRHDELVKKLRNLDCFIKLIQDCDVTGAISTAMPNTGIDLLLGVGGAPEGVISAAALKCLGGYFQGILMEKNSTPTTKVYEIEDLAKGNTIFAATGITNGTLLNGVRYTENIIITNSILMRSQSRTVRKIEAYHIIK